MDSNRVKGVADQAVGKIKEGVGYVVGDAKLKASGKAQNAAGKIENAVGGAKDALREATHSKS